MREPTFLRQNKEKWQEYEASLTRGSVSKDPDRLAHLYVQLIEDLSYARTFYPRSQTVRYLNGLAARTHLQIYQNKRSRKQRLLTFWTEEIPAILASSRRELLASFAVFTFVFLIGLLTAFSDDGFVRAVLGDPYVNMTIQNIEAGDPMGVYKDSPSFVMFLQIAINNIRVALFAFAAGFCLSIGTIYVLFQNGLMLGAFFGLFYLHGDLSEALPVIYIHGTLELSAIVIAGAAGLKLGNGILFPGTLTRRQSIQLQAKQGVKIILGLVPVFIMAAWLESYITRLTEWPLPAKMLVILLSLGFVVGYYLWYPWYWEKIKQPEAPHNDGSQGWFAESTS